MKVLITGAASGIGRSVAEGLLSADFAGPSTELLLVDRPEAEEALDAVRASLALRAARVVTFLGDLACPAQPVRAVAAAEKELGGLDLLVSNAGIILRTDLRHETLAEYELDFAVNARATWLLGQAAHPLLKRSGGALVATASLSANHPTTPLGAYSASKAALVMLVRQMALDWGPDGIRCNTVSPGPTITGMTAKAYADPEVRAKRETVLPLRRLNEPEDIANAILFLASPSARTITGVDLAVDGGLSLSLMTASGGGSGR